MAVVWSGFLTFGLVSFPVQLAAAARRKTIDFDLLHRTDHSRIRQVSFCQAEDKPLKREEMVKGYAFEKDRYVVFEPEEITRIAPATAKNMEIVEFIDQNEVDPIFLDVSYYVSPTEGGEKPYALLYRAMRETKYGAVAKVAMHSREHTVLLRCGAKGLILHTLFYADEVRASQEYPAGKDVSAKEMTLAKSLIEQLSDEFDAEKYHDAYRERLQEMIDAKMSGKKMVATPPAKTGTVVNIMDALQRSLKEAKPPRKPPQRSAKTEEAKPAATSRKQSRRPSLVKKRAS